MLVIPVILKFRESRQLHIFVKFSAVMDAILSIHTPHVASLLPHVVFAFVGLIKGLSKSDTVQSNTALLYNCMRKKSHL